MMGAAYCDGAVTAVHRTISTTTAVTAASSKKQLPSRGSGTLNSHNEEIACTHLVANLLGFESGAPCKLR
jgi:hypothetical protein